MAEDTTATAAENPGAESRLTPSELETAARMILGHDHIRVLPGSWWSYLPRENLITYPAQLLGEWSTGRLVGAICHETAEARYTGTRGSTVVWRWLRAQSQKGLPAGTAMLLAIIPDVRPITVSAAGFAPLESGTWVARWVLNICQPL